MGYTSDESWVRVDFFKPSGKWYTTEQMKWDRYVSIQDTDDREYIVNTFKRCVNEQFKGSFNGMFAVCLHPYHEHEHPLMITVGE